MTLSVALKDGDSVQIQEDTRRLIGKLTVIKERSMSQNISYKTTDEQSENWAPINNDWSGNKEDDTEGAVATETKYWRNRFERLFVVSRAVKLDKIRYRALSSATDEVNNLLYLENFISRFSSR